MIDKASLDEFLDAIQELSKPEMVQVAHQVTTHLTPYANLLTEIFKEAYLRAAVTKAETARHLEKEYDIPWEDALLLTLDTQVFL